MSPTIEFLFDFGSPNAYLSHRVLPGIAARTGAAVIHQPILLGGLFKATGNVSPAVALQGTPNKLAHQRVEMERFVRRHGIAEFRPNPHFPVNTLNLMRGAVAAQRAGVFMPYVEAMFAAMWRDPLKLDDPEIWKGAIAGAGLDAETLIALSQSAEVKAALLANTDRAAARGAFGSPTFFVGDEMFFGKDQLRDVEDAVLSRLAPLGSVLEPAS